jgi:hypothetical protein
MLHVAVDYALCRPGAYNSIMNCSETNYVDDFEQSI